MDFQIIYFLFKSKETFRSKTLNMLYFKLILAEVFLTQFYFLVTCLVQFSSNSSFLVKEFGEKSYIDLGQSEKGKQTETFQPQKFVFDSQIFTVQTAATVVWIFYSVIITSFVAVRTIHLPHETCLAWILVQLAIVWIHFVFQLRNTTIYLSSCLSV